jgi:hypothetical protein
VSSQLTRTSTATPPDLATTSRRAATIDLELQSAYKFGLAVVLGAAAIWVSMPIAASAAIMIVSVLLAGRSLSVIAADPRAARTLRPREFATWDGNLAASLALLAIVLVIADAASGAAVAGAGAIVLAALRLRTRYVTK